MEEQLTEEATQKILVKKTNGIHFNTSVTAIKSSTSSGQIERSASLEDSTSSKQISRSTSPETVSIYTGTLSVKNLKTKIVKTYDWFANLNSNTFDLNSTTTITLTPDTYELTLLLTKGETQYAGKKLLTIKDKDSLNVDFALSPVIGDVIPDIKALEGLMNFELKYDVNDFYSLNSPNISLGVDNEDMANIKINKSTGCDKLFMNIPTGNRTIKIKLYDGHKQVAKATTNVSVGYGGDIKVGIEPLKGDLSFDLNTISNSFDIKLTIPKELFESTRSIENTRSVIKVVCSDNNNTLETQEFNIVKNNGVYQADLSFTNMKIHSTVSVEITFFNKEDNDDKLAGKMTIIVPSLDQHKKVSASFEVYGKAGLGGNVLASLSMNIHNVDDNVLSGIRVYIDNKFIGLSNHTGYFSTLLTKGIHNLTFFQGTKLIASKKVTLKPLDISNIIVKTGDVQDPDRPEVSSNPFKIIVNTGKVYTIELNPKYDYNYAVDCNNDGIYEITSRTSRYACIYIKNLELVLLLF
jgi:hypothetical protein